MKRSWKVFLLVYVLMVPAASAVAEDKLPGILALLLGGKGGTVVSADQTWMDRNLGASRVATGVDDEAAYGDLYQWGRGRDGHEKRTSDLVSTLSNSDTPGHGDFITPPNSPHDWRSEQNDSLWQGVTGINNPCPAGFRLPTETEWQTERISWGSENNNSTGAYNSPLKLVPAGYRSHTDGTMVREGRYGYYWSGTVSDGNSRNLYFLEGHAGLGMNHRADGLSVRCIMDAPPVTVVSAGQTWMDRNLGAYRVATDMVDEYAYGDLYQWGRGTDGHEKRDNSGTTSALSSFDTPGHEDFITVSSAPYDWREGQNDNLWQGASGINNPCPAGFRLPTAPEWSN
jgi:uncharacterized protein (TIGR02145 family)